MQIHEMTLEEHPFLTGIAAQHHALLMGCAQSATFTPGSYLFHEGEPANAFYLLLKGKVMLEVSTSKQAALPIETIEAGEVLGWSWLFTPYRWHFSARAIEPVQASVLDAACLRAKCEEDHTFGYTVVTKIASILMQRLQATRLQLLDLYQ
ncbi:MAG TPA: cyclic nucleotide-binding domain-containing protein [Dictyobacter sp.]|jgi:CRP-like cAMP-binding protein|nr:cyclic nucleotide-binding domain-containing protein [Dictyobacter sp.]